MDASDIPYEIEDGGRFVRRYELAGWHVEIATAYNALADNWPVHVYAAKGASRSRSNAISHRQAAGSLRGAFTTGQDIAQAHVLAEQ